MNDDVKWLALCLVTEDDEPHAYIPLAWAIRNRMEHRNRKLFADSRFPAGSAQSVILKESAFSAFNVLTDDERARGDFDEVAKQVLRNQPGMYEQLIGVGYSGSLPEQADIAAEHVLEARRLHAPFSHRVLYFLAPGALEHGLPSWWGRVAANTIRIPGLTRWIFGEVKP